MKRHSDEAKLQRDIVKALTSLGFRVIRINAGLAHSFSGQSVIHLSAAGTPDLLVVDPYLWIEVKDRGKLSTAQQRWHAWALARGVPIVVAFSVRDAADAVLARRRV